MECCFWKPVWNFLKDNFQLKLTIHRQCGVTTHFSTEQNLSKKYWEKINIGKKYWLRKINIDKIKWEKLFDRSADHK